jgi:hypothetical protein
MYLWETLEDGFHLLWGDSFAGIADWNLHFFAFRTGSLAAYTNLAFGRCEFDRVSNQIWQHLHDAASVADNVATHVLRRCLQGYSLGSSGSFEFLYGFFNDFANVMLLDVQC